MNHELLHTFIAERAVFRSTSPLVLASGKISHTYFDMRRVSLHPVGSQLIASELLRHINSKFSGAMAIGGPSSAAIPVVAAVVALAARGQYPLSGFYVRSQMKPHGLMHTIENQPEVGTNVVLVDDVVTTGKTLLDTINTVRIHGLKIMGVVSIIDREHPNLPRELHKYAYESLFTMSDF